MVAMTALVLKFVAVLIFNRDSAIYPPRDGKMSTSQTAVMLWRPEVVRR